MSRFGSEVFDRARGTVVSPEEHHEWAMRLWRRMDRDLDQRVGRRELDCEEFRSVLRAALAPPRVGSEHGCGPGGPRYARAQSNMTEVINACLCRGDITAKSRSLSFSQFEALTLNLRQPELNELKEEMLFAMFDLNSDFKIDELEFREVYRFHFGQDPKEVEFQKEWGRLDSHARGRVSRGQFISWLRGTHRSRAKEATPKVEAMEAAQAIQVAEAADRGETEETPEAGDGSRQFVEMERLLSNSTMTERFANAVATGPAASQQAAAAAAPWKPWQTCGHLCWEQRRQPPCSGPLGMRLSRSQADDLQHSLAKSDGMKANSLVTKSLRPSVSLASRPKWNPYLSAANPNWIRDGVNEDIGKPRQHMKRRALFSRPQSLPELQRFYNSHRGFHVHRASLEQPEFRRPSTKLSTDRFDTAPEDLCPGRACSAGSQRDRLTGKRQAWNDAWRVPESVGSLYQPGTIGLRMPGPPPPSLRFDPEDSG